MTTKDILYKNIDYYKKLFTDHPNDVGLTYIEHMELSLKLSYKLGLGSVKAFIHSFLPFIFIKSTTNIVNEIEVKLKDNDCKND